MEEEEEEEEEEEKENLATESFAAFYVLPFFHLF